MFIAIDSFLLGKAQKFCDKVQWLTGLTKFSMEKWTVVISNLSLWGGTLFIGVPHLAILVALQSIISFSYVKKIEHEEADFLKNGRLVAGPFHIALIRIIFALIMVSLFLSLVRIYSHTPADDLFATFTMSLVASSFAGIYFSACTPRPPSKSKIWELYEKGLRWLNDQFLPSPEAIPNK